MDDPASLTEAVDQYVIELAGYHETVQVLSSISQDYISAVDSYQEGVRTEAEMKKAVEAVAGKVNEAQSQEMRLMMREMNFPHLETEEEIKGLKDFELIESGPVSESYESVATEAELAYHRLEQLTEDLEVDNSGTRIEQIKSLETDLKEASSDLKDNILNYKADFLEETLGTSVAGEMDEGRDNTEIAAMNRISDMRGRKRVMRNPNDLYLGWAEGEAIEDWERAREKVREKTPRGKGENEGLTDEELERNNEAIDEAKERIQDKDELRYID